MRGPEKPGGYRWRLGARNRNVRNTGVHINEVDTF